MNLTLDFGWYLVNWLDYRYYAVNLLGQRYFRWLAQRRYHYIDATLVYNVGPTLY